MELNREQIIKALELCHKVCSHGNLTLCKKCPLYEEKCSVSLPNYALALIKELTEENERLRAENEVLETNVKDLRGRNNGLQRANESLAKDCDILEDELNECVQIKADTVRKMQERLEAQKFTHKNFGELVYVEDIDQIAKEMLEG